MWDKYELFNLSLVEMAAGVSVFNLVNDNLNVAINLSGLSFSNCNYDTNQKVNTNNTIIGTFQFGVENFASKTYQGQNFITFDKNNEMCNLHIYYTEIQTGSTPILTGTQGLPNVIFIFDITGVSIDPDTESSRRIE
jgi:hypothetical protein